MKNRSTMTMSKTINNLFENKPGFVFSKSLLPLYIMKEITSSCIFHDYEKVFGTFKHLE